MNKHNTSYIWYYLFLAFFSAEAVLVLLHPAVVLVLEEVVLGALLFTEVLNIKYSELQQLSYLSIERTMKYYDL